MSEKLKSKEEDTVIKVEEDDYLCLKIPELFSFVNDRLMNFNKFKKKNLEKIYCWNFICA